jgi:Holliday junction resolvase RusA-like endonuclease
MTHTLSFEIDPIAKGRPQFSHHAFTPTRTREYENAIAVLAREQFTMEPFTGPIKVSITFYMPTHFQKRWGQPHTFVPDADNLAKSVADPLRGIVWKDDSAIAILVLEKVWAERGSVEVAVTQLKTWEDVIATNDAQAKKTRKLLKLQSRVGAEGNDTITGEEYLRGRE